MLNEDEIAMWQAATDLATWGPWYVDTDEGFPLVMSPLGTIVPARRALREADARFISMARQAMPALLDAYHAQAREIQRLRAAQRHGT